MSDEDWSEEESRPWFYHWWPWDDQRSPYTRYRHEFRWKYERQEMFRPGCYGPRYTVKRNASFQPGCFADQYWGRNGRHYTWRHPRSEEYD